MRPPNPPLLSFRDYTLLATLLLISYLIYWPGLSGGFVFDDFGNLIDNPAFTPDALHAHFWASLWSSDSGPTDRPLSMLTFGLQDWFTGLSPWPLKLVNVSLHITNAFLIFLLTRAVLNFAWHDRYGHATKPSSFWLVTPNTIALLVAAAWVTAPIQLTAVLYVIQRMESLSALFVLIGLLLYWQGRMRLLQRRGGGWWRILTGLLGGTILAALAKETGVMLPVYAFLLEWLLLRGRTAQGFDAKFIWLYLMVLVLPGILGILYTLPSALDGRAYMGRPFDLVQRLWTEGRVLIDYLHWIVAPSLNALSLYHDDIPISTDWHSPWTTTTSWAVIAGLISAAFWLKNRAPLVSLGILWFFAGHTLVSTYLPLEIAYEHRNYLPSWGVFVGLFGLIFTWAPKDAKRLNIMRTLTISGVAALITLYASFTALRAQTWGSPYRLAYFEATTHPDSPRASYDLARIMMISASSTHSPLFQMGLAQMRNTARLPNAGLQPDQALIFIAAKNRMVIDPSWWSSLRSKITARPLSAEDIGALYSLITCQVNDVCIYSQHDIRQLGKTLHLAVIHYPEDASVITLYANYSANITHNFPLAYQLMQQAVALNPMRFEYWKNLVTLQIAAGLLSDAQTGIERMRELNRKGVHGAAITTIEHTLQEKARTASTSSGVN